MSKQIELLIRKIPSGKFAIVDDEDYERLVKFTWVFFKAKHLGEDRGYAYTYSKERHMAGKKNKYIAMHNMIMNTPEGMTVDHIHGDSLDNRKSELRIATQAQNLANRKTRRNNKVGFKGVSIDKNSGKYMAKIAVKTFDTPEEAARMYDKWARIAFGEFALLNFDE